MLGCSAQWGICTSSCGRASMNMIVSPGLFVNLVYIYFHSIKFYTQFSGSSSRRVHRLVPPAKRPVL